MGYAVLRVKKLKTVANVASMLSHIQRSRPTPNADPKREHYPLTKGDGLLKAKERIEAHKTPKKDSAVAVETVLTMSPEDGIRLKESGKIDEWADKNLQWLEQTFGRGSVTHAELHLDETTPHIHALVQPIDDKGRLNVNMIIGGQKGRDKLRKLQTGYAEAMKEFGLERGVEGSRARYGDVQRFYGAVEQALEQEPPAVERGLIRQESAEAYRERITPIWQAQHALAVLGKDHATVTDENAKLKAKVNELTAKVNTLEQQLAMAVQERERFREQLTEIRKELNRTGLNRHRSRDRSD